MYIKFDGSSVEFDRVFVGLLMLGADKVSATAVGARDSILISGVMWNSIVGDS